MQQCIYKGFCSAGLHPEDKSDIAAVAARLRGVAGACRARPKQAKHANLREMLLPTSSHSNKLI